MNNLAKNLNQRVGNSYHNAPLSEDYFKDNDIVNLSCDQHGFKSVYSVAIEHKHIIELMKFYKNEKKKINVPKKQRKGFYMFLSDEMSDKLYEEDKSCLEKQTNNQVNFDDKEQIYLCDGIINYLVFRKVFFNEPLYITGLASDMNEVRRANIKLVN